MDAATEEPDKALNMEEMYDIEQMRQVWQHSTPIPLVACLKEMPWLLKDLWYLVFLCLDVELDLEHCCRSEGMEITQTLDDSGRMQYYYFYRPFFRKFLPYICPAPPTDGYVYEYTFQLHPPDASLSGGCNLSRDDLPERTVIPSGPEKGLEYESHGPRLIFFVKVFSDRVQPMLEVQGWSGIKCPVLVWIRLAELMQKNPSRVQQNHPDTATSNESGDTLQVSFLG